MTHTWILNIYIQKFWFKNLKSVYTWIFNFYIQNFRYKNLKSIYNIFFFPFLSFLLLFFLPSKFQPLETPSKIKILIFFIILIISSPSGKYLDNRGFFQAIRTIWEISRLTRIPESFEAIREFSRLSGNFPAYLEIFWTIWKISRPSINFLDHLETFQTVRKLPGTISKTFRTQKFFRMAMPLCHEQQDPHHQKQCWTFSSVPPWSPTLHRSCPGGSKTLQTTLYVLQPVLNIM